MFEINKKLEKGKHKLKDVVKGLDASYVLIEVFGDELNKALNATVELNDHKMIMWIDEDRELISVNYDYFKKTENIILYLDFVHELIHIKQLWKGEELFNEKYSYVDRPTEVEAYKYTVKEAKRIGLSKLQIIDYLKVDWVSNEDHRRLVEKVL